MQSENFANSAIMKWFLLVSLCLVAVSAAPDDLVKLMDPKVVTTTVGEAVAASPEKPAPKITKQGSAADRHRLLSDLFTGYNKKINPDNVKLNFGVSLIDFHVCEKRNVIESYVWLKYDWEDSRLKWNPEEYDGTDVIRLESSEVWKPDVTLYNSADPVNMVNCWSSNVLIYSSGKILWVPPCKMTSQCHLTLSKHPYGEQTCTFKFGSWTFDGYVLDIQLYKQLAGMDLSDLNNSSGFEILSTTAQRNEKFYSCCPEPYPDITFNFTMKRIPGEELFNKM
jgi:nicotinic acetylcholine receptor